MFLPGFFLDKERSNWLVVVEGGNSSRNCGKLGIDWQSLEPGYLLFITHTGRGQTWERSINRSPSIVRYSVEFIPWSTPHLQSRKHTIKMSPITSILILVLATCALSSALPQIVERQAASGPNYGCQCTSYTWRDAAGLIHGNCQSSEDRDGGAVWCYVEFGSTCQDLQPSSRFNGEWSYEACATPAPPIPTPREVGTE